MAATNQRATWANMLSKLKAMGGVSGSGLGEPRSKMQSGFVAVIPESGRIDETVLNGPREIHVVTVRRYENAFSEPSAAIDTRLDAWRAEILEDIWGDFDLGGTIAYALPASTTWNYGYQTVENTQYRLLDLSLSYRVDPTATFTQ